MPRHIAFLRAINVGGRTVKMDRLRGLFLGLGFDGVATFIASGNVVFDSPEAGREALEARIERLLERELGFEVATFLRSPGEVREIAEHRPFPEARPGEDGSALSVAFLKAPPDAAAERRLLERRNDVDDFQVRGREVYWLRRARMMESIFSGAALEKLMGGPATVRNVTTVRRLAVRYGGE